MTNSSYRRRYINHGDLVFDNKQISPFWNDNHFKQAQKAGRTNDYMSFISSTFGLESNPDFDFNTFDNLDFDQAVSFAQILEFSGLNLDDELEPGVLVSDYVEMLREQAEFNKLQRQSENMNVFIKTFNNIIPRLAVRSTQGFSEFFSGLWAAGIMLTHGSNAGDALDNSAVLSFNDSFTRWNERFMTRYTSYHQGHWSRYADQTITGVIRLIAGGLVVKATLGLGTKAATAGLFGKTAAKSATAKLAGLSTAQAGTISKLSRATHYLGGSGSAMYRTSMWGSSAATAYKINPDTSYGAALAYATGVTTVNWVANKMFGNARFGSGWITNFESIKAISLLHRLGMEGTQNALEEGFAQLFTHFIEKLTINPDRELTFTEIIDAAIIGGLIGMTFSVKSMHKTMKRVSADPTFQKAGISNFMKNINAELVQNIGLKAIRDTIERDPAQIAIENNPNLKNVTLKQLQNSVEYKNAVRHQENAVRAIAASKAYIFEAMETRGTIKTAKAAATAIELVEQRVVDTIKHVRNNQIAEWNKTGITELLDKSKDYETLENKYPHLSIAFSNEVADHNVFQNTRAKLKSEYGLDLVPVTMKHTTKPGNTTPNFIVEGNAVFMNADWALNSTAEQINTAIKQQVLVGNILDKLIKANIKNTPIGTDLNKLLDNVVTSFKYNQYGLDVDASDINITDENNMLNVKNIKTLKEALLQNLLFDEFTIDHMFNIQPNRMGKFFKFLKTEANKLRNSDKIQFKLLNTAINKHLQAALENTVDIDFLDKYYEGNISEEDRASIIKKRLALDPAKARHYLKFIVSNNDTDNMFTAEVTETRRKVYKWLAEGKMFKSGVVTSDDSMDTVVRKLFDVTNLTEQFVSELHSDESLNEYTDTRSKLLSYLFNEYKVSYSTAVNDFIPTIELIGQFNTGKNNLIDVIRNFNKKYLAILNSNPNMDPSEVSSALFSAHLNTEIYKEVNSKFKSEIDQIKQLIAEMKTAMDANITDVRSLLSKNMLSVLPERTLNTKVKFSVHQTLLPDTIMTQPSSLENLIFRHNPEEKASTVGGAYNQSLDQIVLTISSLLDGTFLKTLSHELSHAISDPTILSGGGNPDIYANLISKGISTGQINIKNFRSIATTILNNREYDPQNHDMLEAAVTDSRIDAIEQYITKHNISLEMVSNWENIYTYATLNNLDTRRATLINNYYNAIIAATTNKMYKLTGGELEANMLNIAGQEALVESVFYSKRNIDIDGNGDIVIQGKGKFKNLNIQARLENGSITTIVFYSEKQLNQYFKNPYVTDGPELYRQALLDSVKSPGINANSVENLNEIKEVTDENGQVSAISKNYGLIKLINEYSPDGHKVDDEWFKNAKDTNLATRIGRARSAYFERHFLNDIKNKYITVRRKFNVEQFKNDYPYIGDSVITLIQNTVNNNMDLNRYDFIDTVINTREGSEGIINTSTTNLSLLEQEQQHFANKTESVLLKTLNPATTFQTLDEVDLFIENLFSRTDKIANSVLDNKNILSKDKAYTYSPRELLNNTPTTPSVIYFKHALGDKEVYIELPVEAGFIHTYKHLFRATVIENVLNTNWAAVSAADLQILFAQFFGKIQNVYIDKFVQQNVDGQISQDFISRQQNLQQNEIELLDSEPTGNDIDSLFEDNAILGKIFTRNGLIADTGSLGLNIISEIYGTTINFKQAINALRILNKKDIVEEDRRAELFKTSVKKGIQITPEQKATIINIIMNEAISIGINTVFGADHANNLIARETQTSNTLSSALTSIKTLITKGKETKYKADKTRMQPVIDMVNHILDTNNEYLDLFTENEMDQIFVDIFTAIKAYGEVIQAEIRDKYTGPPLTTIQEFKSRRITEPTLIQEAIQKRLDTTKQAKADAVKEFENLKKQRMEAKQQAKTVNKIKENIATNTDSDFSINKSGHANAVVFNQTKTTIDKINGKLKFTDDSMGNMTKAQADREFNKGKNKKTNDSKLGIVYENPQVIKNIKTILNNQEAGDSKTIYNANGVYYEFKHIKNEKARDIINNVFKTSRDNVNEYDITQIDAPDVGTVREGRLVSRIYDQHWNSMVDLLRMIEDGSLTVKDLQNELASGAIPEAFFTHATALIRGMTIVYNQLKNLFNISEESIVELYKLDEHRSSRAGEALSATHARNSFFDQLDPSTPIEEFLESELGHNFKFNTIEQTVEIASSPKKLDKLERTIINANEKLLEYEKLVEAEKAINKKLAVLNKRDSKAKKAIDLSNSYSINSTQTALEAEILTLNEQLFTIADQKKKLLFDANELQNIIRSIEAAVQLTNLPDSISQSIRDTIRNRTASSDIALTPDQLKTILKDQINYFKENSVKSSIVVGLKTAKIMAQAENNYKQLKLIDNKILEVTRQQIDEALTKDSSSPEAKRLKRAMIYNKIDSARLTAMLSNPSTWLKNKMSNIIRKQLDKVTQKLSNFMIDTIFKGDVPEGQLRLTTKQVSDEARAYATQLKDMFNYNIEGNKFAFHSDDTITLAIRQKGFKTKWINKYSDVISKMLQGEDVSKVVPAAIDNFAQIIEVNKKVAWEDNGNPFAKITETEFDRMFELALYRAKETYFKDSSNFLKALKKWEMENPLLGLTTKMITPFPRVMWNLTRTIYSFTPINAADGMIKMLKAKDSWHQMEKVVASTFMHSLKNEDMSKTLQKIKQNPNKMLAPDVQFQRYIEQMTRGFVGTMLIGMGMLMAQMGWLSLDEDDHMGVIISIMGGEGKIRIGDLAPGMTPIAIGAVLTAHNDTPMSMAARSEAVFREFASASLFGAFDDVLRFNPNLFQLGLSFPERYLTQFIPTVYRRVLNVADPRLTQKSSNSLKRLLQTYIEAIPGGKGLLPQRIDPYTGEPIRNIGLDDKGRIHNLTALFIPVRTVWREKSAEQRFAEQHGINIRHNNASFTIDGDEYDLERDSFVMRELGFGKKYEDYQKARGRFIRHEIRKIMNQQSRLSVEEIESRLNGVAVKGTNFAKVHYWAVSQNNTVLMSNRDLFTEYNRLLGGKGNLIYRPNISGTQFIKR